MIKHAARMAAQGADVIGGTPQEFAAHEDRSREMGEGGQSLRRRYGLRSHCAQEEHVSGLELLAAIAIGYEVSSRINRAGRIRPGIHPHGTFGVIGAALAVARMRRLPAGDYRRLINIAAGLPLASSYNSIQDGATVRNVFTGHSAFMGINAVRFTEAGFTGEKDGVRTTFGTVLGDAFEPEVALAGLGTDWMTANGYFKLQPTARSIHPAIDAVEDAVSARPRVSASRLSA